MIAAVQNMRVKNLISSDQHDVVWATWLLECLENKQVIPWQPRHMIHMSPSTRDHFAKEYDRYGDSYYVDSDEQQLREVFERIDPTEAERSSVAQLEAENAWMTCPLAFLGLTLHTLTGVLTWEIQKPSYGVQVWTHVP